MKGMADYVLQWFPAFFLGAVYGKLMDATGSARSLANAIVKLIGPKFAVAAVFLPCMLMTYGGISLFVVVFVIYPMGYAIYRAADLPRTLLPGAIAFGAFGITMTAIPGSPQIQNIIPTSYYHTTAMAAPLLSVIAVVVIGVPGYIYLEYQVRHARKKGLHFTPDPKHKEVDWTERKLPSWHWLCGIVPLVVVVLMLNLFPTLLARFSGTELASNYSIVIALFCGIIVCCLMNLSQARAPPRRQRGRKRLYGRDHEHRLRRWLRLGGESRPRIFPFINAMLKMPGSILFSEAVAVNVLAGATGSASGGMSIALEALAPKYLELARSIGLDPGSCTALHRCPRAVLTRSPTTVPC